jgi:uncharacterized cupredoxin-like copper-binding protein
MKILFALLLLAAGVLAQVALGGSAWPHAGERATVPGDTEETTFGKLAEPKMATRTIRIEMSDKMRFSPAALKLRQGETVRFIARNSGKVLHEMVLGTEQDLRKHADLMRRYPGMQHSEAYMLHVKPGKTGSFTWRFTQAGEFRYACLIPGHFEAGMVGSISVAAK